MTKFNADTVQQFMAAANKKFHGQNLGMTVAHPAASYTFNKKTNKLIKLVFTCSITEDFAQVGGGKPDKANKDAIKEVADRAEAHEDKHKAGYNVAFKKFDADGTAKDLMAKTYKNEKEAKDAIHAKREELTASLKTACLALHQSEGLLVVTPQKDGSFDITMKAAGATGCDDSIKM
ncbi:MAG TPA: hypothetical protein VIZ17_18990 [Acetobacteraceae bacterium]